MPAQNPQDTHRLIAEAMADGDIDAAIALFEPGASVVSEPGKDAITGIDAIRGVVEAFASMKATLKMDVKQVIQSGDLALLHSEWSLTGGTGPDGSAVNMGGKSAEVVRRQPDGTWLLVIDNPFAG